MDIPCWYKHPKLKEFVKERKDEQYEFSNIKLRNRTLLVGPSGSGKTNAFMSYLQLSSKPKKGTFAHIFVCYKTDEELYDALKEMIPREMQSWYKTVKEFPDVNEFPDNPEEEYLVVFDDCINDVSKLDLDKIKRYYTYSRKKGISLFFLGQSYTSVNTFIRKNTSYLLLADIKGNRDLNFILRDYPVKDIDVACLRRMYEYATHKRNDNDMPVFKINCGACPIDKKFSRNFLDFLNPDDFAEGSKGPPQESKEEPEEEPKQTKPRKKKSA
jgi:energy-coupling factor transporter ATP-binding protein EcfA2